MQVSIAIAPPETPGTFAGVTLDMPDGGDPCHLRVEGRKLSRLGPIHSEEALDFLLLAAVIYALDRRVLRASAADGWTRGFAFELPVASTKRWSGVREHLERCLAFLSGDRWEITFRKRKEALLTVPDGIAPEPADTVSLFSGGLDSFIGVVDHLEANPTSRLLLVGHHDPRMAGPFGDQRATLAHLTGAYPNRSRSLLIGVGADSGDDTSLRSRSFLFIALGLYAAATLSGTAPLLVPENGTIALNAPLTPSRFGTCSTRTAHPHYLDLVREVVAGIGLQNPIINPLMDKTKGECVVACANPGLLKGAYADTASCAKRGHRSTWLRRKAKQCGRCMPCIYRRAALHKAGLDSEVYGRDVCEGEVDPNSDKGYADDFRACLSFLRSGRTRSEIAELLVASGGLGVAGIGAYADLVARTMDEIRALLRDKATDQIQRAAGLTSVPAGNAPAA